MSPDTARIYFTASARVRPPAIVRASTAPLRSNFPPAFFAFLAAMSFSLRRQHLLPQLLLVLLVPTAVFYARLATSMSAGVTFASLVIVALGCADARLRETIHVPLKFAAAVAAALVAHLLLASLFGPIDPARAFGSMLMLMLMIVAGHVLATQIMRVPGRTLRNASAKSLAVLAVIGMFGALGLFQPLDWEKPAFPFTEPSHLAVAAAPFLVVAPLGSRPLRRAAWLLAFVALGAVLQNLTMMVACALAACITLRPIHLVALLALLVPIALSLDLNYFLARLDFSQDNQNLSSLVFLQGWELMGESLTATHDIGRGFQQLGLVDSNATATQLIFAIIQDSLNLFDGGFTLSKMVCELGVVGIALAVSLVAVTWRAARVLRKAMASRRAAARIPAARVFAAAILIGYLIELLVRGVGYFSSSGLLTIASLWVWYRTRPVAAVRTQHRVRARLSGATISGGS